MSNELTQIVWLRMDRHIGDVLSYLMINIKELAPFPILGIKDAEAGTAVYLQGWDIISYWTPDACTLDGKPLDFDGVDLDYFEL